MAKKKAQAIPGNLFIAVLLLGIAAPVFAADRADKKQPPKELTPAQQKTFENLRSKKYFLVASCAGVSDAFLAEVGLPAIGQSNPVRGDRGDMDRRGENAKPPWFTDSVIRTEKPYLAFTVEAEKGRRPWVLKLSRESHDGSGKGVQAETRFEFNIDSRLNRPSCELMKLRFQAQSWTRDLDFADCLSVHDAKDGDPLFAGLPSAATEWLRQDCAIGLHYFKAAKDLIAAEARKALNQPKE